jgi:hypothetical protein
MRTDQYLKRITAGAVLSSSLAVAAWGWPLAPPRPTRGAHINGAQGNTCLRPTSFGT